VYARAYCRNLKTKSGKPFGLIRLEAEQRFDPRECPLDQVEKAAFAAMIWKGRYGNLASTVTRLSTGGPSGGDRRADEAGRTDVRAS
jgi:hypothetical protein